MDIDNATSQVRKSLKKHQLLQIIVFLSCCLLFAAGVSALVYLWLPKVALPIFLILNIFLFFRFFKANLRKTSSETGYFYLDDKFKLKNRALSYLFLQKSSEPNRDEKIKIVKDQLNNLLTTMSDDDLPHFSISKGQKISLFLSPIPLLIALCIWAFVPEKKQNPIEVQMIKEFLEVNRNEIPKQLVEDLEALKKSLESNPIGSDEIESALAKAENSIATEMKSIPGESKDLNIVVVPILGMHTPTPTSTPTPTVHAFEKTIAIKPTPVSQKDHGQEKVLKENGDKLVLDPKDEAKGGGSKIKESKEGEDSKSQAKGSGGDGKEGDQGKQEGRVGISSQGKQGQDQILSLTKEGKEKVLKEAETLIDELKKKQDNAKSGKDKDGEKSDGENIKEGKKEGKSGQGGKDGKEPDGKNQDGEKNNSKSPGLQNQDKGNREKPEEGKTEEKGEDPKQDSMSGKKPGEKTTNDDMSAANKSSLPKFGDDSRPATQEKESFGGLDGKKRTYNDVIIPMKDEKYNVEGTGSNAETLTHEDAVNPKTKVSQIELARPEPIKDQGQQYIPPEYEEVIK